MNKLCKQIMARLSLRAAGFSTLWLRERSMSAAAFAKRKPDFIQSTSKNRNTKKLQRGRFTPHVLAMKRII